MLKAIVLFIACGEKRGRPFYHSIESEHTFSVNNAISIFCGAKKSNQGAFKRRDIKPSVPSPL